MTKLKVLPSVSEHHFSKKKQWDPSSLLLRLHGSTADDRTVTVMFHMWQQKITPSSPSFIPRLPTAPNCPELPLPVSDSHTYAWTHRGLQSQPREATAKVMTSETTVSILSLTIVRWDYMWLSGSVFRNKGRGHCFQTLLCVWPTQSLIWQKLLLLHSPHRVSVLLHWTVPLPVLNSTCPCHTFNTEKQTVL